MVDQVYEGCNEQRHTDIPVFLTTKEKKVKNNSNMSNTYETVTIPCGKCGTDVECTLEQDTVYELYPDEVNDDNLVMVVIGNPTCVCGHKITEDEVSKFIDG